MKNFLSLLSVILLAGCASSNPNTEVMTDTNSKAKQNVIGESARTVRPAELGDPSVGGEPQ